MDFWFFVDSKKCCQIVRWKQLVEFSVHRDLR